ncbi:hypothetical protein DPMN_187355 [Dreissena polymorpha]|uniref:Uncharacterized protein n=1 Tax=Dreissena polymorpha TaxID=45954 RepID=A0A9D4DNV9_DREPO|nr:hypothetical protein DPMN_187355 [Dreissena polymorpha]
MPRFKKKASLSVYRSKKRKIPENTSFMQMKRLSLGATPIKTIKRCHMFSPVGAVKRRNVSASPRSMEKQSTSRLHFHISSTGRKKNIHLDESITTPVKLSLKQSHFRSNNNRQTKMKLPFIDTLQQQKDHPHLEETNEIVSLLNSLVSTGRFSTSNICYKLFLDTLRWHAIGNTSGMRYSDETKELFWTSKLLLGGQFIRFMRGFAHQGRVSEGKCQKGVFYPSESKINFAVPCDTA